MKTGVWTAEEIQKLKDCYVADGPTVLAKLLDRTTWSVVAKARRLGIESTRKTPPKNFEWTEKMLAEIRERYVNEGGSKLAKQFGVTIDSVRKKASEMNLHTIAGHKQWGEIRASNNTSSDIHYFDEWSPNMAYVLGFLFADGCIDKDLRSVRVCTVSTDDSILEFIRKETKSVNKIHRVKPRLSNQTGRMTNEQSMVILSSTVMVDSLIKLGLKPRKSYENYSPPDVPEKYLPDFIRGYFDGNGTACVTGQNFCYVGFCGSPKIIEWIRDSLISSIGMRTHIIQYKKVCASVQWSALEDIRLFRDFVYPEGFSFCLQRKLQKIDQWLSGKVN